jgi:hypothetical protein
VDNVQKVSNCTIENVYFTKEHFLKHSEVYNNNSNNNGLLMYEKVNAYNIFIRKRVGKGLLDRPRRKKKNNIEMDFRGICTSSNLT